MKRDDMIRRIAAICDDRIKNEMDAIGTTQLILLAVNSHTDALRAELEAAKAANATLKAERDEARELAVYLAEPHALQTPRIVGLVQKWEEELNVKWYSKRPAPVTTSDAGDNGG